MCCWVVFWPKICGAHLLTQLHHHHTTMWRHVRLGGTLRVHCNEQLDHHRDLVQSPSHWQLTAGAKALCKAAALGPYLPQAEHTKTKSSSGYRLPVLSTSFQSVHPKTFLPVFYSGHPPNVGDGFGESTWMAPTDIELSLSEVSDGRATRRGQLWWPGIMKETSNLSHTSAWKSRALKNNLSPQCCRT